MRERIRDFFLAWAPSALVVFVLRKSVLATKYQQQRESSVFFDRANVAYGLRKRLQLRQHTTTAFLLLGDDFAGAYRKFILATVLETFENPSARQRLSGEVIEATRAIGIESSDATGWYQLSRGLCAFGFLRAAWYARENSLDLSIREGSEAGSSENQILRALQAKLERRMLLNLELDLEKIVKSDEFKWIAYRDYFEMISGKWLSGSQSLPAISYNEQDDLARLVTDKYVALVAPGEIQGEYGHEIDKSDIVVRIKFVGKKNLPAQKFFGSRCEISQYNMSITFQKLDTSNELPDFINDLKLILLSSPGPKTLGSTPCVYLSILPPIYRTTLTSGLRPFFALIRSRPKTLKLFGFDFYSSRSQYNSSVLQFYALPESLILGRSLLFDKDLLMSPSQIARGFRKHDPFSNFCFAQNLYQAGLFEIEPVGKSILELTPYQYVERLEKMLGDW